MFLDGLNLPLFRLARCDFRDSRTIISLMTWPDFPNRGSLWKPGKPGKTFRREFPSFPPSRMVLDRTCSDWVRVSSAVVHHTNGNLAPVSVRESTSAYEVAFLITSTKFGAQNQPISLLCNCYTSIIYRILNLAIGHRMIIIWWTTASSVDCRLNWILESEPWNLSRTHSCGEPQSNSP